jgi:phosphomethylpyrimidine synthase
MTQRSELEDGAPREMATPTARDLSLPPAEPLAKSFPRSHKVWRDVEHRGADGRVTRLRVPARRIHLTDGTDFDVYDTSGPEGCDPRQGLPAVRS